MSCKTFHDETSAKHTSSFISRRHYFYCPTCGRRLIRGCMDCYRGIMLQPPQPSTGDYDEDGHLEHFCTRCGNGYIRIQPGGTIDNFYISKRDIRRIIDRVFTRQQLQYKHKETIEEKVFENCRTRGQIIELIAMECGESTIYLNTELTGRYVNFSSNR